LALPADAAPDAGAAAGCAAPTEAESIDHLSVNSGLSSGAVPVTVEAGGCAAAAETLAVAGFDAAAEDARSLDGRLIATVAGRDSCDRAIAAL
jgi:hypothetical protein